MPPAPTLPISSQRRSGRSAQPTAIPGDVALVDIDMPRGGGLRAVPGILKVAPQTAVVLPSAGDPDAIVAELMRAGAAARQGHCPRALADLLISSMTVRARGRDGLPTSFEATA